MNDGNFLIGILTGILFTICFIYIVQSATIIKPCEKNLPRTQHCELTAKVSEDKDE